MVARNAVRKTAIGARTGRLGRAESRSAGSGGLQSIESAGPRGVDGKLVGGDASGWCWSGVLHFLIASQDERLLRALAQHSPESRFQQVDGVAGALRALQEHDYDGAALDGGLPPATLDEFTRWWDSLVPGAPVVVVQPAAEQRRPVARRAVAILDALRARRTFRLVVEERVLEWAGVRVRLTRSEARVLSTLVEAGVPLSARALQEMALGYAGDGSAVRTHVSTMRKKCGEAGLDEPIVTRDRRYRAPQVRLVPQVG